MDSIPPCTNNFMENHMHPIPRCTNNFMENHMDSIPPCTNNFMENHMHPIPPFTNNFMENHMDSIPPCTNNFMENHMHPIPPCTNNFMENDHRGVQTMARWPTAACHPVFTSPYRILKIWLHITDIDELEILTVFTCKALAEKLWTPLLYTNTKSLTDVTKIIV